MTSTRPTAPVILPPSLQALEQKMRQLQVNSESFATTATASFTLRIGGRHGKHKTRTTQASSHTIGQVSLSPREGTVTDVTAGTPKAIEIGTSLYLYFHALIKRDHGRPWVHFKPPGSDGFELFPFNGESSIERNDSGTGPYAGLLNLLATATGPVGVGGSATVDGQQTTEFTATVEPLKLVKTSGAKELAKAFGRSQAKKLEIFIAESGLPVRVVLKSDVHTSQISVTSTETTDVTTINEPFTVVPPPAGQTIGEARFAKLLGAEGGGLLSTITGNGSHRVGSHRKGSSRKSKQ